jgi:hypothetical protein
VRKKVGKERPPRSRQPIRVRRNETHALYRLVQGTPQSQRRRDGSPRWAGAAPSNLKSQIPNHTENPMDSLGPWAAGPAVEPKTLFLCNFSCYPSINY